MDSALVLNVPAMPLPPGRYEWRLTVEETEISTAFQVLAPLGCAATLMYRALLADSTRRVGLLTELLTEPTPPLTT